MIKKIFYSFCRKKWMKASNLKVEQMITLIFTTWIIIFDLDLEIARININGESIGTKYWKTSFRKHYRTKSQIYHKRWSSFRRYTQRFGSSAQLHHHWGRVACLFIGKRSCCTSSRYLLHKRWYYCCFRRVRVDIVGILGFGRN